MTSTQRIDRQTFLAYLRQSGLIDAQELKELLPRLPDSEQGKVLARALVSLGVLTRFQASLLLAGRTSGFLLGQYRILDQLGQGGMGRVFKAVHQTMNRVVALKVLAPQLTKTDRARQMFEREVRAAGRLMHPNIVTAYDANQVGDRFFLVMEYVEGHNLEQLIGERGPLPVGLACDIIRQTANGLQYAHELGMVHRDIKPANLLVGRGATDAAPCVVKILDFGLARLNEPAQGSPAGAGTILTRDNTVMGTPDYLSPEQSRNLHKVDIRADLYSLGCTFYYALTGQVPFPGGNRLEKMIRHSTEEATPVTQLRPEIPEAVAAIVHRLLAKNAADRFQTPAELAAALAPFAVPGPANQAANDSDSAIDLNATQVAPSGSISTIRTVTPDQSPTPPLSGDEMPIVQWPSEMFPAGQSRRLKVILCLAGAAALAALAVAGWLLTQP
jgi:serine/threonine-protein kinase